MKRTRTAPGTPQIIHLDRLLTPCLLSTKAPQRPVSTDGRGLSKAELGRRLVKGDESAQRFLRGRFLREGATSRIGGVINVALRDARKIINGDRLRKSVRPEKKPLQFSGCLVKSCVWVHYANVRLPSRSRAVCGCDGEWPSLVLTRNV